MHTHRLGEFSYSLSPFPYYFSPALFSFPVVNSSISCYTIGNTWSEGSGREAAA